MRSERSEEEEATSVVLFHLVTISTDISNRIILTVGLGIPFFSSLNRLSTYSFSVLLTSANVSPKRQTFNAWPLLVSSKCSWGDKKSIKGIEMFSSSTRVFLVCYCARNLQKGVPRKSGLILDNLPESQNLDLPAVSSCLTPYPAEQLTISMHSVAYRCSVDCPATVVPWTTVTGSCTTTCTSTSTA